MDLRFNYGQISTSRKTIGFSEEIKFVRIERTEIFVISAFMDYRIKPGPDIKIFGLAPLGEHKVWCRFSKAAQVRAQIYIYKECCRPFGQWKTIKMTCAIPISVQNITSVGIYANNNHSNMEIQYIKVRKAGYLYKRHGKPTLGICMKSLFSYQTKQDVYSLIEYMELQKMLGYSKLFLYGIQNCSKEVMSVIEYYQKEGFLDLQPWILPVKSVNVANTDISNKSIFSNHHSHKPPSVQDFAQILAHYDCLYRHMDDYSYLAYTDIDEFIVPSAHIPLIQYLGYISKNNNNSASFRFNGFRFCDTVAEQFNHSGKLVKRTDSFMYLPHEHNLFKSIIIPKYVFDIHIHFVKNSVRGTTRGMTIVANEAMMYHFRKGQQCNRLTNTKVDFTFKRFDSQLYDAMTVVIKQLKLS